MNASSVVCGFYYKAIYEYEQGFWFSIALSGLFASVDFLYDLW